MLTTVALVRFPVKSGVGHDKTWHALARSVVFGGRSGQALLLEMEVFPGLYCAGGSWHGVRPMQGLEEYSDAELRRMDDAVLIYRHHVPWGAFASDVVTEPVDLCRLRYLNFHLPRLRLEALDLRRVSFTYQFVGGVPDLDLAAVRSHIVLEDEVHLYLRRLGRNLRADCGRE